MTRQQLSKTRYKTFVTMSCCSFIRNPKEQLDLLFQSLTISILTYAIEVLGCCYYDKYLKRIDKLFARVFTSGYCSKKYSICDILTTRDSKLWNKITSNTTALDDLLPPRRIRQLRSRGHDYILPRVHTSRFKSTFVNRCLFSIVYHQQLVVNFILYCFIYLISHVNKVRLMHYWYLIIQAIIIIIITLVGRSTTKPRELLWRSRSFHYVRTVSHSHLMARHITGSPSSIYESHKQHNMASNYKGLYGIFYKTSIEVVKSNNSQ